MKNFKILNILLVVAFLFSLPVVHAHEVEINNQAIRIEQREDSVNSESKILVDLQRLGLEEDSKYTLYYQYVIVENQAYNSYIEKDKEQANYIKEFLESNNLEKIEDGSKEQIKSYNNGVKAYETEKEAFLPAFVESNWIETKDATAKLDLTKVPTNELGIQPYVLWMKVETNDGSFYGDQLITVESKKVDEEAKEEVPKTGDEILLIAIGALAISGLMIISYKKVNA